MLEDDDGICGYALGALDSRGFYDRYDREWRPAIWSRSFPSRAATRRRWTAVEEAHHHLPSPRTTSAPSRTSVSRRTCTSTCCPVRRAGATGARMMERNLETLRRLGSPGAHLGVSLQQSARGRVLSASRIPRAESTEEVHLLGARVRITVTSYQLPVAGTGMATAGYWKLETTTDIMLALFGGPPIRTRPFPSWPVFGQDGGRPPAAHAAQRAVGKARWPAGRRVRAALRRDARLPARRRGRQRHRFAANRAAGGRNPGGGRGHRAALHVSVHGFGGRGSERGPGFRRHRPRHVQPRSGRRRRPRSRRALARSFRFISPASRPTWTRSSASRTLTG